MNCKCGLIFMLAFLVSCKEHRKSELLKSDISSETKDVILQGPQRITRTIKQDRKGNIWMASWDGVFRYDGKTCVNITSGVSSARFFSVLEDREGNFWFASIGSGVYCYNGISFQNFTAKDGLASDRVGDIYQDKAGRIWFATEGGISCYDPKYISISGNKTERAFRNFTTEDGLSNNDAGSIIEDKTGKFWIGTRGKACIFDGKTFTDITQDGKPFTNVQKII